MPIEVADPRPVLSGGVVAGSVCPRCGTAWAWRDGPCPECLGPAQGAALGPGGTVWSAATVWLAVGDRTPPFTLVYVDLDGGARVLARLDGDGEPAPGTRVVLAGTDAGDLLVRTEDGR